MRIDQPTFWRFCVSTADVATATSGALLVPRTWAQEPPDLKRGTRSPESLDSKPPSPAMTSRSRPVTPGNATDPIVQAGHVGNISAAAFSPDGRHVITACDRKAILWNEKSAQLVRTFGGFSRPVSMLAITPDGEQFLTGSLNKKTLWQTSTAAPIRNCAVVGRFDCPGTGAAIQLGFRWRLAGGDSGGQFRRFRRWAGGFVISRAKNESTRFDRKTFDKKMAVFTSTEIRVF